MKTILVLIAAALLSPSVLFGQKIMKENGMFIIDLSNMDSRVITKTYKNRTTTASDESTGRSKDDISSAESNETLYYKFEIIDEPAWRNGGKGTTWKAAIDSCSNYEKDGKKDWRLPTQKELVFLGVLSPRINALGCTALINRDHLAVDCLWAATEVSGTMAWRSTPATGEMWNLQTPKSLTQYRFVCIRELP